MQHINIVEVNILLAILDHYLPVTFNTEIFDRIFAKEKMFNYLEFFLKIMVLLISNYFPIHVLPLIQKMM